MAINWNNLDTVTMTSELAQELKAEYEELLDKNKALAAKRAEILDESKRAAKKYAAFDTLLSDVGIESLDELKALSIKGKAALDPEGEQAKTLQELREQRQLDLVAHQKVIAQLKADADSEKNTLLSDKANLDQKYKQSIIRTKIQQALSADFTIPDDGIVGLNRLGYSIDLESEEEDQRPWEDRKILLYRAGKSIGYGLEEGVEEVKKNFPHYLRSTFTGGSGHNNRGGQTQENPWETGNRTQQLIMMQREPDKAVAMKASAGK